MVRYPFKSAAIKAAFAGSKILHDERDLKAIARLLARIEARAFEAGYLEREANTLESGPLRIVGGRDHGNDTGKI